jgi:hypothetical protein
MFSIHKYLRKNIQLRGAGFKLRSLAWKLPASFGITTRQSIRALACYAKKIKKACELMKGS